MLEHLFYPALAGVFGFAELYLIWYVTDYKREKFLRTYRRLYQKF